MFCAGGADVYAQALPHAGAMYLSFIKGEFSGDAYFPEFDDADWTIDSDDVRVITGTMGRFPGFRPTGWKVLRSAQIVRDNERNGTKRSRPALGAAC